MNKYLCKVANLRNFVHSAGSFTEDLLGRSASKLRSEAEVLSRHAVLGNSPAHVQSLAEAAERKRNLARLKTGLTLGGLGTVGVIGAKQYHKSQDDAIMNRLISTTQDTQ